MPTRDTGWIAGAPSWVDLAVPDQKAAIAFYGELFGWTFAESEEYAEGYRVAEMAGRAIAGIARRPSMGLPGGWSTYLASPDADATAAAVLAAGGRLYMKPFDIRHSGRMFFGTAPDGSTFGVWQAGRHLGAGLFDEPGSYTWTELLSRDPATARAFYTSVFDYEYDDISVPGYAYWIFRRPGSEGLGGIRSADALPADVDSLWVAWFAVASCDDALAQVATLGGSTLIPPIDSPFGRAAVLIGAQGETFGVIDLAASTRDIPPTNR